MIMRYVRFPQLELAYINTSHPDFIGGSRAIAEVMERNRAPSGGVGAGGPTGGPEVRAFRSRKAGLSRVRGRPHDVFVGRPDGSSLASADSYTCVFIAQ